MNVNLGREEKSLDNHNCSEIELKNKLMVDFLVDEEIMESS